MREKAISSILLVLLLLNFHSCDYFSAYNFKVKNSTESNIVVEIFEKNDNSLMELKGFYLLTIGDNSVVFIRSSGSCAKDCPVTPLNLEFISSITGIDSLSIKKDGISVEFDYLNSLSNWNFHSVPQTGFYEIEILDSDFD